MPAGSEEKASEEEEEAYRSRARPIPKHLPDLPEDDREEGNDMRDNDVIPGTDTDIEIHFVGFS